jgi:hypothetical protein
MIGIVYQWIMDPAASVSELHRDLKELLGGRYDFRRGNLKRNPSATK